MTAPRIIDLFAGPGGWDVGLRSLGVPDDDVLGIEWDAAACSTRRAAGLRTLRADVAMVELPPRGYAPGLIASPPCQAWSMAGARKGEHDRELVAEVLAELARGRDVRAEARAEAADERSILAVEPLRWALAMRPAWIACEQVPPALELWEQTADHLGAVGYHTWTGTLQAEQYGVPQTRKRAFLLARLDRVVGPPPPTHQRYVARRRSRDEEPDGLFDVEPERIVHADDRDLLPWVSMGDALGYDPGGIVDTGQNTLLGGGEVERYERSTDDPACTVTSKSARQWRVRMVANKQRNASVRPIDAPAPTIKGGHDTGDRRWIYERPATTIACDPRVHPPGHKENRHDEPGRYLRRDGEHAVKVSPEQAAVLQSFPADYPWQGSKTKQHEQIGNAVPPMLAAAVLRAVM